MTGTPFRIHQDSGGTSGADTPIDGLDGLHSVDDSTSGTRLATRRFVHATKALVADARAKRHQNPLARAEIEQTAILPQPLVRIPSSTPLDYRLELLQQWEGVVDVIGEKEFTAHLYDLTDKNQPEEEATLSLEEVSPSDRALVERGAVFYWSIGYRTGATGQKDRVSQLRFRRLPAWTASERRAAEAEAGLLASLFEKND